MNKREKMIALETSTIDARACRRIGIISDSHGPIDPRVRAKLGRVDGVIHAGDFGGSEALRSLADIEIVVAVHGNNDTANQAHADGGRNLLDLPEVALVELCVGHLIVIHGHQFPRATLRHDQLRKRFPDALAIIYGHSHRRDIDQGRSPWILNPGACGHVRTFGGPSGICLELHGRSWRARAFRCEPQQPRSSASAS